jgi:hypothetical protein
VSNLQRRVASLEDGAPGPCPVCSHDPDAVVTYEIVWETDTDPPTESSPPCYSCGNQSIVVVGWEDEVGSGSSFAANDLVGDDVHTDVHTDAREGAAAQVPDYPPSWNDEGGGVDG